jgi:hypothetical protein
MITGNSSQSKLKVSAFERLFPSSNLRLFIVLLIGIGIGLMLFPVTIGLIFTGTNHESIDQSYLSGSMYQFKNTSPPSLELNTEEVTATITSGFLEDSYVQTVVEVESLQAVNLNFEFSTSDFSVATLRSIEQTGNSNISGGVGFVNIANEGKSHYVFLLKAQNRLANHLDLKIYSENRIVYSNSITIGK